LIVSFLLGVCHKTLGVTREAVLANRTVMNTVG
jgi:hypothetical protein